MVDLHTHILPGMDDGADTVEDSIEMLSDAYKQGVRVVGATSHAVLHRDDSIANFLQRRKESAEALHKKMDKISSPLPRLILGAEVFFDHDLTRHPNIDALCFADSPYILVEFPLGAPYNPYWSEWLHSLIIRGFKPIVAHIDRYMHAEKMVADFCGLSITYQINAARFRSFGGRRFISRMIDGNAPCIVASDMHNMTSRSCDIEIAYQKARKKYSEKADLLFRDTAKNMLKTYLGGDEHDKSSH